MRRTALRLSFRVLVLQLKRYKYNVYTGQFYKVTDPVTLPALVDMESYCCEECEAPASISGASPCEGKENVGSRDSVMATKGTDENYRKCGEVRRKGRGLTGGGGMDGVEGSKDGRRRR